MPLPRRKLKRKQKKSTAGDGSSSQNFTVQQLLDAADRFGEEAVPDYNLIEQLLSKAVELDPQSSAALDRCGEFHCQHGDPDTALQLLKRSAEIAPESNWQTYLYLAQLSAGREAFALYEKGAELLLKGRVGGGASGDGGAASSSSGTTPASNAATNAVAPRVVATVASIYVAVCELFMTDLCDEPDAQTQCERNLQRAYDLCGDEGIGSVEVLTGLAVYNKVTMELDKASEFARKAGRLLESIAANSSVGKLAQSVASLANNPAATTPAPPDAMDVDSTEINSAGIIDEEDVPADITDITSEVQVKLATCMIDLALYTEASTVLDRLVDADDEDVQVWYLKTLLCVEKAVPVGTESNLETGRVNVEVATEAQECLEAMRELLSRDPALGEVWGENLAGLERRMEGLVKAAGGGGSGIILIGDNRGTIGGAGSSSSGIGGQ